MESLPVEIWNKIQLFNSHPCADLIRNQITSCYDGTCFGWKSYYENHILESFRNIRKSCNVAQLMVKLFDSELGDHWGYYEWIYEKPTILRKYRNTHYESKFKVKYGKVLSEFHKCIEYVLRHKSYSQRLGVHKVLLKRIQYEYPEKKHNPLTSQTLIPIVEFKAFHTNTIQNIHYLKNKLCYHRKILT